LTRERFLFLGLGMPMIEHVRTLHDLGVHDGHKEFGADFAQYLARLNKFDLDLNIEVDSSNLVDEGVPLTQALKEGTGFFFPSERGKELLGDQQVSKIDAELERIAGGVYPYAIYFFNGALDRIDPDELNRDTICNTMKYLMVNIFDGKDDEALLKRADQYVIGNAANMYLMHALHTVNRAVEKGFYKTREMDDGKIIVRPPNEERFEAYVTGSLDQLEKSPRD